VFSILSFLEKNKSRPMRSPCCLCLYVCESPLVNFECLNQSLSNLVRTSRHLSPSQRRTSYIPLISLCLYVYPPIVARQRLGIYVTATTNTGNKRRISGGVVFYAMNVVSKESLCNPVSLLGNGSLNTFPWQQSIVGGVVFYAVRVVSK
jgi:hypothetical protein